MDAGTIMAIASAASAVGSIQQGAAQKAMYELQGAQASLEARRKALQYEQRANETLRKLNEANAAVRARAFAGGVSGFDGSAALVQIASGTRAGRDYMTDIQNALESERSGGFQQQLYKQAGKTAMRAGYFDAAGKLGMAAGQYGKIGGAPTKPAPIIDKSMPVM